MNIREKLSRIQYEFKSKKSRYNSFGKYNFRSAEDILESLKPLNEKYGVYFTVKENLTLGEFPIMHSTAIMVDAESGETIEATAIVGVDLNAKGQQMPQRFGSASSYGKKYALGNLLLIDDTAVITDINGNVIADPSLILIPEFDTPSSKASIDYTRKTGLPYR